MAGSKKNKQKKASSAIPPPPPPQTDDGDLMDDLFAQLDERNSSSTQASEVPEHTEHGSNSKQDSKSRFKARQNVMKPKARKAAALEQSSVQGDPALDARLEQEAREEQANIDRICTELGLQLHEVNPDGHCLFSSVADQLEYLGILPTSQANYAVVRQAASQYILAHPDDFIPFLPSPNGEDRLLTPEEFQKYCVTMRDTAEWGGEPEIQALSKVYNVPIHVIQGGRPPVVEHQPTSINDKRIVRISYHRRMYGLGEHYNSLRPKSTLSNLSQKVHNILSSS